MVTARHSGKLGDLIFALPCIKALGIDILYLPETTAESPRLLSNIRPLLQQQPYLKEIREYPSNLPYLKLAPGIHIDYDLDQARLQPSRGLIHIVLRYLNAFHVELPNWKEPWLIVDDVKPIQDDYTVINYTGRHITNDRLGITSKVDWAMIVHFAKNPIFIGTGAEHVQFCKAFGFIPYQYTDNMLDIARVVKNAKAVYCNQSSVMALAQSLGVEYWGAFKPGKRNCIIGTKQEHILQ